MLRVMGVVLRKNGTPPLPELPLSGAIHDQETPCTDTSTILPGTLPPEAIGVVIFEGE